MNEFKRFHPAVNLIYFVFVLMFAMWFINPVSTGISFVWGFVYVSMFKSKKNAAMTLAYLLPAIGTAALINTLFNHRGATILWYFPSGNPLTAESVFYGFEAAMIIASVILIFIVFNEIMTSDKIIYLFGRIMPSLSLIISMTLRFVPRFTCHFKEVYSIQKINIKFKKGLVARLKLLLKVISIVTTWALESSIDTSDSMKSRGYGLKKRTAYSIFKFTKRDIVFMVFALFFGIYVITGKLLGAVDYTFFPIIHAKDTSPYSVSIYAVHSLLCIMPFILEIGEVRKWKALKSKI